MIKPNYSGDRHTRLREKKEKIELRVIIIADRAIEQRNARREKRAEKKQRVIK